MRIDVVLLPGQAPASLDLDRTVGIVVDVLRASSSIVTLLERGAAEVLPAASIEAARDLHGRLPSRLLCGEEDGLPPAGFDHGNSPAEFSQLELAGRSVILATANGTRLVSRLAEALALLVGSLLNRTAVARAAIALASGEGLDVAVVCSAAHSGSTFVLEDALGAGAIVDAALRLHPAPEPSDAARFSRDAFGARAGDLAAAVASARHARELAAAGLAADVEYCARLDVSNVVPELRREGDLLALRPRSP